MAKRSVILLVFAVAALLALGVIMLASTSFFMQEGGGEEYFTLRRQLLWMGVALVACCVGAFTDYNLLMRWRWVLFLGTAVLLALCLVPGVGLRINGASRWLSLGIPGVRLQPSEFAKITLIVALAAWFARYEPFAKTFLRGFIVPACLLALYVLLVGFEVDLGTAFLLTLVGSGIMFVAGTRLVYLGLTAGTGAGALIAAIRYVPNRFDRVMAVWKLDEYKDTWGLQQWVAQLAFGSGGLEGLGLGGGRMKLSYLPEAHTDFIFPMIGEELGFYGTALTVLLFVFIAVAGMCISAYAPNRFGKLLGCALTLNLGLEALLNMGVTTALLPNKGLPLPFVSYGGSSLVAAMLAVGILINIHRQGVHLTWDQLPVIRRKKRWTPQL